MPSKHTLITSNTILPNTVTNNPVKSTSKRAIGYCRVSTKEQGARRNGLDSQAQDIERFCEYNDIHLIGCVIEIASGGWDLSLRPTMAWLVEYCKQENIILMTSKLDRFSRSVEFVSTMLNRFVRQKIKFISCEHGESAEESFLYMSAVWAQKERKDIGARTKKGLEQLAARGVTKAGKEAVNGKLLGSVFHKDGGKKARAAGVASIVNKANEYAEKMKPIIEPMRKSGLTLQQIADTLSLHKTPTANGGKWSACSVRSICNRWN